MRFATRDLLFGVVAFALVVTYLTLGSRAAPVFIPGGTISPTPSKPVTPVPAPRVSGTIAFSLRGDIFLLRDGQYSNVTAEGRSLSPFLSSDGRTLLFTRRETIDGKRSVDGQVTPALLHYSDIIRKDASGGTETIVVTGLKARNSAGFHDVAWHDGPALSPDGAKVAIVTDLADGTGSNLEVYASTSTASATKRLSVLSAGSDLADPSWSPDGKTIAVTSYTLGVPRLLLVPVDGRDATPLKVNAAGEAYRPTFTPDGKWLVYTLRLPGGGNDVHAVEIATGRDVALTSDAKSWNGVPNPEGTSIAFLHEASGVIDLYVVDLGGALGGTLSPRTPVKLTRGEGIDGESRPSWSR